MSLDSIVDIQISSESTQVSQAGFGRMLILDEHSVFAERYRIYEDAAALLSDGFSSSSLAYKMALKAFSQEVKPVDIAIGRRAALESVTDALAAIRDVFDDWYALALSSRLEADILEAAGVIESLRKVFVATSEDADVLTTATTDVASDLEAAAYARTLYLFSKDQENGPDAALLGRLLPETPGFYTPKFKTLAGITVDSLTPTEKSNAKGKKANIYTQVGGVNIVEEGITASGEFLDTVIGIDWFHARLQERIFSRLVNSKKIPYTDAGAAIIENEIRAQYQEAVRNGMAADGTLSVTMPLVSEQSSVDRAARYFPGIKFSFQLAGAIHKLEIKGTVTV